MPVRHALNSICRFKRSLLAALNHSACRRLNQGRLVCRPSHWKSNVLTRPTWLSQGSGLLKPAHRHDTGRALTMLAAPSAKMPGAALGLGPAATPAPAQNRSHEKGGRSSLVGPLITYVICCLNDHQSTTLASTAPKARFVQLATPPVVRAQQDHNRLGPDGR